MTKHLHGIDGPADLQGLDDAELQEVAQEIRAFVIENPAQLEEFREVWGGEPRGFAGPIGPGR